MGAERSAAGSKAEMRGVGGEGLGKSNDLKVMGRAAGDKSRTPLTSLRVGLPLKKSVFLLLFEGLNLGLRKAQPLAMASRGAGPSYGKERPTNSCRGENTHGCQAP